MIRTLAFDADDTLWHCEPHFHETQAAFLELLKGYHEEAWIERKLLETEVRNLRHFGYGVKGFTLSMIETAIELTEGRIAGSEVQKIIELGRAMLLRPIEVMEGVAETLALLERDYSLMLITKGDLFDQQTKLARSGLGARFARVEVVSEKDPDSYRDVLARHGLAAAEFLMVGNSLKSDILPVLELGGAAVHIPYHLNWALDTADPAALEGRGWMEIPHIRELPALLAGLR